MPVGPAGGTCTHVGHTPALHRGTCTAPTAQGRARAAAAQCRVSVTASKACRAALIRGGTGLRLNK
jgi:hypothetical protein